MHSVSEKGKNLILNWTRLKQVHFDYQLGVCFRQVGLFYHPVQ